MDKKTVELFIGLFKEVVQKFFGKELDRPLTENESKLMCVEIEEKTGLVLGFKSVKNYSIFVYQQNETLSVNPSLATLDTLARYVLDAPAITEVERKRSESHYPYWNSYRKSKLTNNPIRQWIYYVISSIGGIGLLVYVVIRFLSVGLPHDFSDNFSTVDEESLASANWMVLSKDSAFWRRKAESSDYLTLFTLESDNWPDSTGTPMIKNMLIRPVESHCFSVEMQLEDFFPKEKWQQAGIILMEDTTFSRNAIRISIAYNDFFGGFDSPPEIIVQGITTNSTNNPEEFCHFRLFQLDSTTLSIIENNLKYSRLRIEKNGTEFRFLVAVSNSPNAAYKEIVSQSFSITPKYAGIFALKGRMRESSTVPVKFDSFDLRYRRCD